MSVRFGSLLALVGSLWLALSGCESDLISGWEVEAPEVRMIVTEVQGDPERSRPTFGETVTLRVQVASGVPLEGELDARFDAALVSCVGLIAPNGLPACFAEFEVPRAVLAPRVVSGDEIQLTVPVPDEIPIDIDAILEELGTFAPEQAGEDLSSLEDQDLTLLLFGGVCVHGTAERVPGTSFNDTNPSENFRCVDNADAEFPDALVFLDRLTISVDPAVTNHNPRFRCDGEGACADGVVVEDYPDVDPVPGTAVLIRPDLERYLPRHAEAFPSGTEISQVESMPELDALPEELEAEGCQDDPAFRNLLVPVGSGEYEIGIRFDAGDFDALPPEEAEFWGYQREELIVSHIITRDTGTLPTLNTIL